MWPKRSSSTTETRSNRAARFRGIWIGDVMPDEPGKRTYLETRLFSRTLADDVTLGDGNRAGAGDHRRRQRDGPCCATIPR